jgi:hypothetical protein
LRKEEVIIRERNSRKDRRDERKVRRENPKIGGGKRRARKEGERGVQTI